MISVRIATVALLCLAGTAALAADVRVSQKDKAFDPGRVTVTAGQSITFRNDDEVAHNVMSRSSGNRFNLKLQRPGEETRVTFETPGAVEVRCAIHPRMKLTVEVVD